MKKTVYALIVLLTLVLLLASCGSGGEEVDLAASAGNIKDKEIVLGVDEIGTVTLDSEDQLVQLRNKYESLSDKEKKNVVDYKELTKAEARYKALVKEEEEKAEAAEAAKRAEEERQAAEEKAEQERLAAAAAAAENEEMVWIPNSGSKYHRSSSCSNMKNPSQVTRSQAESWGYEPCKKCY